MILGPNLGPNLEHNKLYTLNNIQNLIFILMYTKNIKKHKKIVDIRKKYYYYYVNKTKAT